MHGCTYFFLQKKNSNRRKRREAHDSTADCGYTRERVDMCLCVLVWLSHITNCYYRPSDVKACWLGTHNKHTGSSSRWAYFLLFSSLTHSHSPFQVNKLIRPNSTLSGLIIVEQIAAVAWLRMNLTFFGFSLCITIRLMYACAFLLFLGEKMDRWLSMNVLVWKRRNC